MQKPDYLKKFPKIKLSLDATLRDAIEVITEIQSGIAIIVSDRCLLQGIVVDSDIRRALLRGESMDAPISKIMSRDPVVADDSLTYDEMVRLFRRQPRAYIPVVDNDRRLVALAAMVDYLTLTRHYPHTVVIMAGGRGVRLKPLTDSTPKPMMKIGSKPVLEHGLEFLIAFGLSRFIFSVNYLEHQIREYFEDGRKWGVRIDYVNESTEMGTAGSLSLLRDRIHEPIMVMNGDIVTRVNVHALLEYHEADHNIATVCVRRYDFEIPYGVVQIDGSCFNGIVEKPTHRFLVNAGIYVLEPKVLQWLEKGTRCEMPEFLERIRTNAPDRVGCFPIQEYWLDIGCPEDYRRAVRDFEKNAIV